VTIDTPQPRNRRVEGFAIVALVLGLVAVPGFPLIVLGVLAVVFGIIARRRTASDPNLTGGGMAIAGVILGALSLLGGILFWVGVVSDLEGTVRYTTLDVGDCYDEPGDDPTDVVLQSCDGAHDREVAAVLNYPAERGEPYPGRQAVVRYAGEACLDGIVDYLGPPFEGSPLADYEIFPTRASWDEGNRRVICALGSEDGSPLVGSQRSQRAG
jgi:hypothetical protein